MSDEEDAEKGHIEPTTGLSSEREQDSVSTYTSTLGISGIGLLPLNLEENLSIM